MVSLDGDFLGRQNCKYSISKGHLLHNSSQSLPAKEKNLHCFCLGSTYIFPSLSHTGLLNSHILSRSWKTRSRGSSLDSTPGWPIWTGGEQCRCPPLEWEQQAVGVHFFRRTCWGLQAGGQPLFCSKGLLHGCRGGQYACDCGEGVTCR